VFIGSEALGRIERRGPTRYRFNYSEEALRKYRPSSIVLSASLRLRSEDFTPSESAPFFEGLLPEGAIRSAISQALRLNERDGFGLLAALGSECAGAVAVLREGVMPRAPGSSRIRSLSEDELGRLIDDLPTHPLGVTGSPEGARLSLGGVQQKLVLARDESGRLGLPLDGTPSTHLLKPEPHAYEDLAVNEAFCMRVAATAGMEAASAEVAEVGSRRCLLVERFDRRQDDRGFVVRLHQEDMCQALGLLPTAKYEQSGGPSVARVIDLLRGLGSAHAALGIRNFVRALVVNFLLGNSDAHGKNFALLYDPDAEVGLAPLYDVVSTAVYPQLTSQMAMSLGGVDDPDRVDLATWARLADEAGIGRVIGGVVRRQAGAILRATDRVAKEARAEGWHRPVIDAIVDVCRRRVDQLTD